MAKIEDDGDKPKGQSGMARVGRFALQAAGGAIPFAGGFLSAIAGEWSEREQQKAYEALKDWMRMLEAELKEKQQTMVEILARLDMNDENVSARVESDAYQALLRKSFRKWAGAESEEKRQYIRNMLANAASSKIVSDEVIRLFIEWLEKYSELHFKVIGDLYNHAGASRGEIWERVGSGPVREDSAEADLFKLLVRDLSTGGIIRQHRPTDAFGNYIKKSSRRPKGSGTSTMKSAFDLGDPYELTELGRQFVHYAMTEVPVKIQYKEDGDDV